MRFLSKTMQNRSKAETIANQNQATRGDDTSDVAGDSADWWSDSFAGAMRTGFTRSADQQRTNRRP